MPQRANGVGVQPPKKWAALILVLLNEPVHPLKHLKPAPGPRAVRRDHHKPVRRQMAQEPLVVPGDGARPIAPRQDGVQEPLSELGDEERKRPARPSALRAHLKWTGLRFLFRVD